MSRKVPVTTRAKRAVTNRLLSIRKANDYNSDIVAVRWQVIRPFEDDDKPCICIIEEPGELEVWSNQHMKKTINALLYVYHDVVDDEGTELDMLVADIQEALFNPTANPIYDEYHPVGNREIIVDLPLDQSFVPEESAADVSAVIRITITCSFKIGDPFKIDDLDEVVYLEE